MEVTLVDSVQGHQTARLRQFADRLRRHHPDLAVRLVEGDGAKTLLDEHRLKFGPAVLVNGRLEYVGVPRWRFVEERLSQVSQDLPNPRSSVKPGPAKGK